MPNKVWLASVLAIVAVAAVSSETVTFYGGLTNTHAIRSVNLQSQLEETLCSWTVVNSGDKDTDFYLVAVAAEKAGNLALATARTAPTEAADKKKKDAKDDSVELKTTRVEVQGVQAPAGTIFFKVQLAKALKPKDTIKIDTALVFTRTLKPYPAEIAQADAQLVLWADSQSPLSPYKSDDSSTRIKLASDKVESHTKPANVNGDTIEYGPYTDVEAFTTGAGKELSVHFQNEFPFVTMTSMKKLIEVSHYGNVNVEEHYVLSHTGAKLKGVFSRFDYQRQQKAGASFRTIQAVLPASATNLYYRDAIGNISTSHVSIRAAADSSSGNFVSMEVEPRFPMFGGWQTDFYIGYDVPASEFLRVDASDSSRYILNMKFACPFPQAAVDHLEVRVILPEFATDIQWVTPFEVDSQASDKHVTYLDTVGRPVLVLKKSNVVRQHDQTFSVLYRFSSTMMLQEPLLIVASFLAFFVAAMIYFRLELAISDDEGHGRSTRQGAAGAMINAIVSKLPDALSQLQRLTKHDIEAAEGVIAEARAFLDELKRDTLLNNCVERLDAQLRSVKETARRALKEGATPAHAAATQRAQSAADAKLSEAERAERSREAIAQKLKQRCEEAEKITEELASL